MPKKKTKIKAVIFDLDGVIIDSEPIESLSLEKLLKEYGKTPKFNQEGLLHTPGPGKDSYKILIKKYKLEEDIEIIRKRKREIFQSFFLGKQLSPMAGFLELVNTLRRKKIKTALASNRFIDHIPVMLESIKASSFFDVIVGPDQTTKHKPAPDIYLKSASKLKLSPKECVVIEDTETGVIAGKNAGMKVVAVPNKYTKKQDFSKADKIVKSLSEVSLSILQNL